MKRMYVIGIVCIIAIGVWSGKSARAYDLPSVNLGFTSFVDGGPPAGPGLYFMQYIQYWTSDEFNNRKGDRKLPPFADEDLNAWISLSQLVYQSDREILFGGKWGLDFIIPCVSIDLDYGIPNTFGFPMDNGSGIGDILIGPFLQWDPIMGQNGPILMHRIELQMILPTGKYNENRELNAGSNFFSFNPYWSGTLFLGPKWTVSMRLHYLWNDKNDDPNRNFGGADDTQAGQAIHANFAVAREVVPKRLRLGLNGYYLKQLGDTEVDGNDVSGSRERVLGLGPGGVYHFSRDNHLFFDLYFESKVEERPKGERFNLRFVHHF